MTTKSKQKNEFEGRWRITWMDQWGQDYVDEEVEGFVEFNSKGLGSFHFGYVQGQIDYRPGTRDGKPAAEFSWDGNDEMGQAMGRGWAVLDGNEIHGMICIHLGDESEFRASRVAGSKSKKRT